MSRFDKYFLMEEEDILEYVREKLDFFPKGTRLTVSVACGASRTFSAAIKHGQSLSPRGCPVCCPVTWNGPVFLMLRLRYLHGKRSRLANPFWVSI